MTHEKRCRVLSFLPMPSLVRCYGCTLLGPMNAHAHIFFPLGFIVDASVYARWRIVAMKRFCLLVPSPVKASRKTSVVRHMWRHSIARYEFRRNHQQIHRRIHTTVSPTELPFSFVNGILNEWMVWCGSIGFVGYCSG
jgi:hypothetical protein